MHRVELLVSVNSKMIRSGAKPTCSAVAMSGEYRHEARKQHFGMKLIDSFSLDAGPDSRAASSMPSHGIAGQKHSGSHH